MQVRLARPETRRERSEVNYLSLQSLTALTPAGGGSRGEQDAGTDRGLEVFSFTSRWRRGEEGEQ